MDFAVVDIDIGDERAELSRGAGFVHANSIRYGLTSNDIRLLGGSEVQRVFDYFAGDHAWMSKGEIIVRRSTQRRIVIKLYKDDAPLAVENFSRLCLGKEKNKLMTYVNCKFHRIVKGFCCQTGDFLFGNGTGGESVFGKKFKDDRGGLLRKHDKRGIVSMCNTGKNSNTSQFFFTLGPAPNCDGKHVVFGEIVSGFDVLDAIEACGSDDGTPTKDVYITGCGSWEPIKEPGAGYWIDYPDPEAYSGYTPIFMVWVRVGIIAPNENAYSRFEECLRRGSVATKVSSDEAKSLLERRTLDIVLVAPACADTVSCGDNIVVCKPAQARKTVYEWAQTHWDGNALYSLGDLN